MFFLSFTAKKNTALIFTVALGDITGIGINYKTSPTLAGGDVKISIDGGSLVNLANLPTVTPPASKLVQVILTAAEMNGDQVNILFSDAAGGEWSDLLIAIRTTVRTVDDVLYPTYPIPDSVAADGTQPTLQQSLNMIGQFLFERAVGGTTVTVKKPDGSSTLMTFSLNDAVNPTSITRAT